MDERRALLMVDDPDLLDAVLRLAAAAGCEAHRALDPTDARRHWADAAIIVLDANAAERCARAALPRRDGIVLVTAADPPPQVWRLGLVVGAGSIVELPEGELWLVTAFTEATENAGPPGAVLAVVGGCGGAGASTLAAATALRAARDGARTLLLDCDPLGGGLDLMLGAEDVLGVRWPELSVVDGRIPAATLHEALPAMGDRGLSLLSCDRIGPGPTAGALRVVVEAGRRAGDTVVCDVPRQPGEAAAVVLSAADLTVLVVPADVRACAAAARVAAELTARSPAVGLVVRGPSPGGLTPVEIARALDVPLLASMRPQHDLDRRLERGRPPADRGPLAAAAATLLTELRDRSRLSRTGWSA